MPLQLKSNSVIKSELGIEPGGKVHKFFQETCYKHMDKYVPMRNGDLRTNVDLSNPNYIVYESKPYAEIQYYGIINGKPIPEDHYTTPGTGPYWDKKMWAVESVIVTREVQRYINRGGK